MHATVRSVIEAASDAAEDICILDTEASPEHLARGTAKYADTLVAVVEPWFKSLETGRRMAVLAKDLGLEHVVFVANKIRDDGELAAVREFAEREGVDIAGVVPYDERLPEAERAGRAPLDFAPEAPAVAAVASLARSLAEGKRALGDAGKQ
jgi:CO dehydrogenase maturation factor